MMTAREPKSRCQDFDGRVSGGSRRGVQTFRVTTPLSPDDFSTRRDSYMIPVMIVVVEAV